MATSLSTSLTNQQAGLQQKTSKLVKVVQDHEELATTELDTSDVVIFNLPLPSSAIVLKIEILNDDLDSHATPTLVSDIGIAAGEAYKDITSGTTTRHAQNGVIDADLFVDGVTNLDTASTSFTQLVLDTATAGADDMHKEIWELLGYDKDPQTVFNICLSHTAGAATAAAGDVILRVTYAN